MTAQPLDAPVPLFPQMAAEPDRVEPAPRRVRGVLNGQTLFDTTRALYVWEWPNYPQYYIPVDDIARGFLIDEDRPQKRHLGPARRFGIRVGDQQRDAAARVYGADADARVAGTARFEWDALDAWFEEDEEIFVHPRNPYVRVDALRSHRRVRVELEGVVLADTLSPVLLFETGLPTRYYVDRTDIRFEHLVPSSVQTSCPYKGTTSDYWSVSVNGSSHGDLAWSYDFPTDAARAVAGMVAFYNEKVDTFVDGESLSRPVTHFFR